MHLLACSQPQKYSLCSAPTGSGSSPDSPCQPSACRPVQPFPLKAAASAEVSLGLTEVPALVPGWVMGNGAVHSGSSPGSRTGARFAGRHCSGCVLKWYVVHYIFGKF